MDEEYRDPSVPTLFPSKEAEELEQLFHDKVGPHTRRLGYFYLLKHPEVVTSLMKSNFSGIQATIVAALGPVYRSLLAKGTGADSFKRAERSHKVLDEQFTHVEELLKSNAFLAGPNFTIADISFAALASPIIWVTHEEGHSVQFPKMESLPNDFLEIVKEFRERPAGQYVLKMFKEHRR